MLDDLHAMMDLLVVQVRDLQGFEGAFLTADEWALLRKHFAETSGFVHPADLYAARREQGGVATFGRGMIRQKVAAADQVRNVNFFGLPALLSQR